MDKRKEIVLLKRLIKNLNLNFGSFFADFSISSLMEKGMSQAEHPSSRALKLAWLELITTKYDTTINLVPYCSIQNRFIPNS